MTLAALLEELKEVDPKLYDDISHLELIGWQQPRNQAMDHLQGCIQRACERQGWTWNVYKQTPEHEKSHSAYISEVAPGYDGDYRNQYHEYCITEKEANFSAEALLVAYIAAVKMKQTASKKQHKKCGNFYMDTTIDSSKTEGNKINEPIY